ncbi:Protein argonaute-2 [Asimina triloba]
MTMLTGTRNLCTQALITDLQKIGRIEVDDVLLWTCLDSDLGRPVVLHRGSIADAFHVAISNNMTEVTGRVLKQPDLNIRNRNGRCFRLTPKNDGQWNLLNHKVVDGKQVDWWAIVDFTASSHYKWLDVDQFVGNIYERSNRVGVRIKSEDRHPGYDILGRICENELGLVTQCLLGGNAKLGGSNMEHDGITFTRSAEAAAGAYHKHFFASTHVKRAYPITITVAGGWGVPTTANRTIQSDQKHGGDVPITISASTCTDLQFSASLSSSSTSAQTHLRTASNRAMMEALAAAVRSSSSKIADRNPSQLQWRRDSVSPNRQRQLHVAVNQPFLMHAASVEIPILCRSIDAIVERASVASRRCQEGLQRKNPGTESTAAAITGGLAHVRTAIAIQWRKLNPHHQTTVIKRAMIT